MSEISESRPRLRNSANNSSSMPNQARRWGLRRGVRTDTNISLHREILPAPKARASTGFLGQLAPLENVEI